MTTVVLSHPSTTDDKRMQIDIHVQAEILTAKIARRKAGIWLAMNIGHLLEAEHPELVLVDNRLIWRFDILLNVPGEGCIGMVGCIELDAISGEVLADEQALYQDVIDRANALTGP